MRARLLTGELTVCNQLAAWCVRNLTCNPGPCVARMLTKSNGSRLEVKCFGAVWFGEACVNVDTVQTPLDKKKCAIATVNIMHAE